MRCPDENLLAEYVDNVLSEKHRAILGQHVDSCVACRQVVSDLARMQHAVSGPASVVHPETDAPTVAVTAGAIRGSVSTRDAVRHRKRTSHIVPGTMIGEYEVTGVLGAGGMGIVFSAVHPRIGKRAAIKILQRDQAVDHTSIVRFENEARAVNAIGHPNIVDIFSFGELPNGDPYYVMEHVDGTSLHEWIYRRGPVELSRAMPIVRQICDALTAAHAVGIVHRDLKPGNIMVAGTDDAPRVKVLDFGLAKMTKLDGEVGDDLTHPGVAIGTPAFMSPEQFMGDDVDQRTDVYALGVLVFQMLTASYPFQGETASAIGLQHLHHEARLPAFVVDPGGRLNRVVGTALSKHLTTRYATVAEMRRDLESCLAAQPQARALPTFASPAAPPEAMTVAGASPVAARRATPDAATVAAIRADALGATPPLRTHGAVAVLASTPVGSAPAFPAIKSAPQRRSGRAWISVVVALVIVGAAIVWGVTRTGDSQPDEARSTAPPPAATSVPQPAVAPPAEPPAKEPEHTVQAVEPPVEPPGEPTPTVTPPPSHQPPRATHPKSTRTTAATKATKATGSAAGSAAPDDDLMLLEGGNVKKSK